jgi:hypothetical protein
MDANAAPVMKVDATINLLRIFAMYFPRKAGQKFAPAISAYMPSLAIKPKGKRFGPATNRVKKIYTNRMPMRRL